MMKLGIDQIDQNLDLFTGKRVGLITNPTGVNRDFVSTIEILKEKTNLVALFAPEHGVRGNFQAGVRFESHLDPISQVMVYSLYTKEKKPTKEMLDEIDVLCIDLQDIGSRFYTYVYTMAYSMAACAEHNKTFVVFDRPNPINGNDYEGNILDIEYRSFVGYYPILQRHGLTIGELASLFNEEYGIGCDLKIVKMEGWHRKNYFEANGLPWIVPSPNIPSIASTVVYNGTCIFEGTNLSEGRGTTTPFEIVGAPFIDAIELSKTLNTLCLPGVHFQPIYFTPTFSKHASLACSGVFLHVTDRATFKPVKTGWAMLDVIRRLYKDDFKILPPYVEGGKRMLQFNTGCNYIVEDQYPLDQQWAILEKETKQFGVIRQKYLLY